MLKDWTVNELIGQGGMGRVYRIIKNVDGAIIEDALKIIDIPYTDSFLNDMESKGLSEEEIAAIIEEQVKHIDENLKTLESINNISDVVCYKEHEVVKGLLPGSYRIFIRMEKLKSLNSKIREEGLTIGQLSYLAIDVLNSLKQYHRAGLFHLDIKPENILCDESGIYKLGDLESSRKNTDSVAFFVSRKFAAPEIIENKEFDYRSDIYSLGKLMNEYLNNGFSSLLLNSIALKACEFRPEKRYSSIEQMKRDIEAYIESADPIKLNSSYIVKPQNKLEKEHIDLPPYVIEEDVTEQVIHIPQNVDNKENRKGHFIISKKQMMEICAVTITMLLIISLFGNNSAAAKKKTVKVVKITSESTESIELSGNAQVESSGQSAMTKTIDGENLNEITKQTETSTREFLPEAVITTKEEATTIKRHKKKKVNKDKNLMTTNNNPKNSQQEKPKAKAVPSYSSSNAAPDICISAVRNAVDNKVAGTRDSELKNLATYMANNGITNASEAYRNLTSVSMNLNQKTAYGSVEGLEDKDVNKIAMSLAEKVKTKGSRVGIGISSWKEKIGYGIRVVVVYK